MPPKPPRAPYPPDVGEEEWQEGDELVDVVLDGLDWANRREVRLSALRDVTFSDCRLDLAGLRAARLERVRFADCRMEECDLDGARLTDVVFERCALRVATLSQSTLERVELRGCDLTGLRGAEALAGARMPWNDVLANAPLFAAAVGIEILEE